MSKIQLLISSFGIYGIYLISSEDINHRILLNADFYY